MKKQKGTNVSVYIRPETMPHYEALKKMAADEGISLSAVLDLAIKQAYYQLRTKTAVSAGAYLALAHKDLGSVSIVKRDDETTELVLSPDLKEICSEEQTEPGVYAPGKMTDYVSGPAWLQAAEK